MILSKKLPTLLLLGTLAACSVGPDKQDETNSSSVSSGDFKITSLDSVGQVNPSNIKGWNIPNSRDYKFTACIQSSTSPAPIVGQNFTIKEGEFEVVKRTDLTGCLTWNKTVKINVFNDSSYADFKGRIIGSGVYKGTNEYTYALAPLAGQRGEDVSEFIWTDKYDAPTNIVLKDQGTYLKSLNAAKNPIILNEEDISLNLNVSELTAKGNKLQMKLVINPKISFKNITGDIIEEALNTGNYYVYAQLVSKAKVDKKVVRVPVFKYSSKQALSTVNGKIRISKIFEVEKTLATGNLEFALKVVPAIEKGTIGAAGKVFNLGKMQNFAGSKTLVEMDSSEVSSYDSYIATMKSEASLAEKSMIRGLTFSKPTYDYEFIDNSTVNKKKLQKKFPDAKIQDKIETSTTRHLVYKVSTDVFNSLDGEALKRQRFRITIPNEMDKIVTSQDDGTLAFSDTLTFKVYKSARWIKRNFKIEHIDSGYTTEIKSYINPWSIFTTGRSAEEVEEEILEKLNNRIKKTTEPWTEAFYYEVRGVNYHIDNFMNLAVKRTILLDAHFQYKRQSDLDDGIEHVKPLRDGIYLYKVAIDKHYLDTRKALLQVTTDEVNGTLKVDVNPGQKKRHFLTIVKKLVKVWNGRVITPVEFTVRDLRLMTIRTNLLFELVPIHEEKLKLSPNFEVEEIHPSRIKKILAEDAALNGNKDIDLDSLIDHDSGLETRTFTGPLIFEEYQGEAGVIKTNSIQDCKTTDCNMLNPLDDAVTGYDLENEEDRKYFGGVEYLKNKTMKDFIKDIKVLENDYKNEETLKKQLSYYLNFFALDYFSLEDKKLKVLKGEKDADGNITCNSLDINDCLVEQDTKLKSDEFNYFMNFGMNLKEKDLHPEITKEELKNFIHAQGQTGDEIMKRRLCSYFVFNNLGAKPGVISENEWDTYIAGLYNDNARGRMRGGYARNQVGYHKAYNQCIRRNLHDVFKISTHYRVNEVGGFVFKGGKKLNFDIGNNFSILYSEGIGQDISIYANAEVSPLNVAKYATKGLAFLDMFSSAIGISATGSGYNDRSWADSIDVSSSTYLSMQRADFDMWFKNYEPCLQIQIASKYQASYADAINKYSSSDKKISKYDTQRGLFLCSGQSIDGTKNDHWVRERFYYFSQHFTFGQMLDDNDLLNQPWLVNLRGEKNYFNFVSLLKNPKKANRVTDSATILKKEEFKKAQEQENQKLKTAQESNLDDEGKEKLDYYEPWFVTKMADNFVSRMIKDETSIYRAGKARNLGDITLESMGSIYENMIPPFPGIFTLRPVQNEYPY